MPSLVKTAVKHRYGIETRSCHAAGTAEPSFSLWPPSCSAHCVPQNAGRRESRSQFSGPILRRRVYLFIHPSMHVARSSLPFSQGSVLRWHLVLDQDGPDLKFRFDDTNGTLTIRAATVDRLVQRLTSNRDPGENFLLSRGCMTFRFSYQCVKDKLSFKPSCTRIPRTFLIRNYLRN
jgi:hypothetical protein